MASPYVGRDPFTDSNVVSQDVATAVSTAILDAHKVEVHPHPITDIVNTAADAVSLSDIMKTATILSGKAEALTHLATYVVPDGKFFLISGEDGGTFIYKTVDVAGTFVDNGGAYCGTVIVPAGGDGKSALVRYQFNNVYNIRWFGAVGQDSVLDTAGIDATVAAMESAGLTGCGPGVDGLGGGTLYFQHNDIGNYLYTGDLVIRDDSFIIKGDGMGKAGISITGTIQVGTANVDPTHAFYDGVYGPSFTIFRDILISQKSTATNVPTVKLVTANRTYFQNVWINNGGGPTSFGIEMISAQWVYITDCRFLGFAQASIFLNAAGHGHGHVHIYNSTMSVSGEDITGTDPLYRSHIVAHSYRGDGTEGSPANCGGNFFGDWREVSIRGCHFYQSTSEAYEPFAAIKSRNYLWPNEISDAGRNESRAVLTGLSVDGSTWFEGIHTLGDFNGQDYIYINDFVTLSNGRQMQGFRMGNGADSLIFIGTGDVSEFMADSKFSITSVVGGTIASGQYFKDAAGNIMIVRQMNATGIETYARVVAPWDIIDLLGGGQAVTFYSDEACTIATGVTATMTLLDTSALISTPGAFHLGAVHIDGANVTKFNIVDFVRADTTKGSSTFSSYGDGKLTLKHVENLILTDVNTDSLFASTWPYNAIPQKYSATPRSPLDLGWYLNSVNSVRVRITRGGATAGQTIRIVANVFE